MYQAPGNDTQQPESLGACPIIECRQVQTAIDGGSYTDELQITVPATHPDSQHLAVGNYLLFQDPDGNWQEYHIVLPVQTIADRSIMQAIAEHCFMELLGEWIASSTASNTTAGAAVSQFLTGTRWVLGTAVSLGTNTYAVSDCSVLAALAGVSSTWGGELWFRISVTGGVITSRYVDILQMRGNVTGKRFETFKDLVGVKQTYDVRNLCTALYGLGKSQSVTNGQGERLDFSNVVWSIANGDPCDKPAGQAWVGDTTAAALYGPAGRHIFGTVHFDNETDAESLLSETYATLQQRKVPLCTYEMDVTTLEEISGLAHEAVRFGDTTQVINKAVTPVITGTARVIVLDRNLVDPLDCKVTLGNFIPTLTISYVLQAQQLGSFSDRAGTWDNATALQSAAGVGGQIQYTLDLLTTQLLSTVSGFSTDPATGDYIWEDTATHTKALRIGGGILAIANTKTNGAYNWTTIATGDGITATSVLAAAGTFVSLIAGVAGAQRLEMGIGTYNDPYMRFYDNGNNLILQLDKTGLAFGTNRMATFASGNRTGIGFYAM